MFGKLWKMITKKVDDNQLQTERHERELSETEWKSKVELMKLHNELEQEKMKLRQKNYNIIEKANVALAREHDVVASNGYWRHFVLDKEGMHK